MSFSRNRDLPVLRRRSRRIVKKASKGAPIKYYAHWAYPTVFIVALMFMVSLYLCQCAQLISVQYKIGELKEHKMALVKEQKSISLNIENLESLERIEKIAIRDLGMVYPSQRVTLDLNNPTNTAFAEDEFIVSR